MGRTIIKLPCDGKDYYLEWSSVVDAPVTYGMPLEEFKEYYKEEYGRRGLDGLKERLERVEETGHSDVISREPVKKWLSFNRAGPKEKKISFEEIIDLYVRRRTEQPMG